MYPSLTEILDRSTPATGDLESHYRAELERLQALPRREKRRLKAKWRMSLASIALMLAMGGSLLLSRSARAAGIDVDGTTCTLADAITSANSDSATNGCAAGSDADTLNLQYDVDLTEELPYITTDITIEGGGHTIQRTGGSDFSVLTVAPTGNLTLKQAEITGGYGYYAGGILNGGTLTVQSCTITNNYSYYGGGITNFGTLTLQSSVISENVSYYGGGIYNDYGATLTVIDSTLTGNNCVENGGGIMNNGYAELQNSTISENSTLGFSGHYGGGIANYNYIKISDTTVSGNQSDYGGGMYNGYIMVVENSTISGNQGYYGGGILNSGFLTMQNSTISGNNGPIKGGGLFNGSVIAAAYIMNSTITGNTSDNGSGIYNYSGVTYVQNSIVALQTSGDDCDYDSGTIISYGYNIESGTSCGFTESSDQQSVSSGNLNLGSLGDNGGPTYTHALLSGSYAIDRIPDGESYCDGGVSTDQRGAVRAGGTATTGGPYCDVGAYEYASEETPTAITIQSIAASIADTSTQAVGASLLASLAAAGGWWLHKRRKIAEPKGLSH